MRLLLITALAACHLQSVSPSLHRDADRPTAAAAEGPRFEGVGSNPFIKASDAPFSTFGVDVDTASYQYFLRVARGGELPHPESVRVEDFINYFDYDYVRPTGDARLALAASAATSGYGRDTSLLRVTVAAPPPAPLDKRPTNLVFLVDVSGSMAGANKLGLVQQTLRQTLNVLAPDDKVSIVTYAGDVRVRLEPTRVADRQRILDEITGLTSGGSTAGAAGIHLAYEQASKGFIDGGINHVLLCTDGDFNVGVSSDEELVTLIKSKRDSGVTLTAIGYGADNLNAAMMERVSNAGNGVFAYLASEEDVAAYVQTRMLATFDHVASDAKIQVEFNTARVAAYRLVGYENRLLAAEAFKDDAADAGEIGRGHRVSALYEVLFANAATPELLNAAPCGVTGATGLPASMILPDSWVRVSLRYKDAANLTLVRENSVALSDTPVNLAQADADLRYAGAVAALAERLKGSPFFTMSSLDAIGSELEAQAGRDAARGELNTLFKSLRPQLQAQPAVAASCTYAHR